jgi:hypothetical protein
MKKHHILFAVALAMLLMTGCTRKFLVASISKDFEFSVLAPYGNLSYTPVVDARSDLDRKGKVENPLLVEFDRYLKIALNNSHLFLAIITNKDSSMASYTFKSSLDKYQVTLNEVQAQQTEACVGGLIGAAIASGIDVTAVTDIQLTGILLRGNQEVWNHTISKQITEEDTYAHAKENAEKSMATAIGETCKELITEMAKYLAGQ